MTQADAPAPDGNAAQIAYWNDRAGQTWTALQERIDRMFGPLTALALEAAAVRAGETVLDVGCGCGATVLDLAARVGGQGHVLGLDVSEPMAARARERIAEAGAWQAEVLVADAATHDFAAARTDLLYSRFGVMFFADPAAAFANLRRAMKPDGRLLFAAWRSLQENSWFSVPLEAAASLLQPQPPADPNQPGPFAFADPDRVRGILSAAGWRDIGIVQRDTPMCLAGAGQVAEAAELATRVGALARLLIEADPDLRSRARDAVAQTLRTYDGPGGVTLSGSVWLVSARA